MIMAIGILLVLVGYSLRLWAVRTLRGSWSWRLQVPLSVIVSGPYRYVRHPAYVGVLLMLVGLALLDVRVALIWFSILSLADRIDREESILSYHSSYLEYKKRVGAVFPRLRR